MATSNLNTQAVVEEVRKTKETAAKLANGDYPQNADHVRVLAGMIQKLAEQVERLAGGGGATPTSDPSSVRSTKARGAEAVVEEDQTPQDAPADPINDRT